MTAPVIPANAVWGVQWEAPVPPMEDLPVQPQQPKIGDGPEVWNAYYQAADEWRSAVQELIALHDEWWKPTVSSFPDEATARSMFTHLKAAHEQNAFTRGTTLVWSAPTVWTAAE